MHRAVLCHGSWSRHQVATKFHSKTGFTKGACQVRPHGRRWWCKCVKVEPASCFTSCSRSPPCCSRRTGPMSLSWAWRDIDKICEIEICAWRMRAESEKAGTARPRSHMGRGQRCGFARWCCRWLRLKLRLSTNGRRRRSSQVQEEIGVAFASLRGP